MVLFLMTFVIVDESNSVSKEKPCQQIKLSQSKIGRDQRFVLVYPNNKNI